MSIERIALSDVAELRLFYLKQMRDVPFCYGVTESEFVARTRVSEKEEPFADLRDETILVSRDRSGIDAYSHFAVREPECSGEPTGVIRFLTHQPGARAAGERVLAGTEDVLRSLGVRSVTAFPHTTSYRFYHLGFGLLSDRLAHVLGLAQLRGYTINNGEVFFEWSDAAAPDVAAPESGVETVVAFEDGRGALPDIHVHAVKDGVEIGECWSASVGKFSDDESVHATFFTEWLGVAEDYRGRGWGAYLLARTVREMRQVGYRDALISTNVRNHRAIVFYSNFGYRAVDTCYAFEKSLS
ncbi:GNAT family N-acetyltransferase [Candidatus Poribacteria bacterium]|nr:GNAT family N-acetyltransferase [Candidatus Poribacteria bacterium]